MAVFLKLPPHCMHIKLQPKKRAEVTFESSYM